MDDDFLEFVLFQQPIYQRDPSKWVAGDPPLLPDRKHFICPWCRDVCSIEADLSYLSAAGLPAIPGPEVLCNPCFLSNAENIVAERERRKR
jgi:hypothetical protein